MAAPQRGHARSRLSISAAKTDGDCTGQVILWPAMCSRRPFFIGSRELNRLTGRWRMVLHRHTFDSTSWLTLVRDVRNRLAGSL
jgi:hypothetical protein